MLPFGKQHTRVQVVLCASLPCSLADSAVIMSTALLLLPCRRGCLLQSMEGSNIQQGVTSDGIGLYIRGQGEQVVHIPLHNIAVKNKGMLVAKVSRLSTVL
jgi:hypothetical protein